VLVLLEEMRVENKGLWEGARQENRVLLEEMRVENKGLWEGARQENRVLLEEMRVENKVLLENMRRENKVALEATLSLRESTDRRFAEIDHRFDHVDAELRSLREEVARKADGAALAALERRVSVLERLSTGP
jgi:hypothetical protein